VRIQRIGFTPLKGGRHTPRETVDLSLAGPIGDRVFCLIDPARDRVLRTVENPSLLQASVRFESETLTAALPDATLSGVPEPTGEVLKVDYWGRAAAVEVCDGPWAAAFTAHLGYPVVLARPVTSGDVVYGAPVTVVTTSSLDQLAERLDRPVNPARFRSTFVVDTRGAAPHLEDGWFGRRLRLGEAEIQVSGGVPRCAVVDLDPATGLRDAPVLSALAGYRRSTGEIHFGVYAVVTRAGRVHAGDLAQPGRG